MIRILPAMLFITCSACVSVKPAQGPGYSVWNQKPLAAPISSVWALSDDAGHIYISPGLEKKLEGR